MNLPTHTARFLAGLLTGVMLAAACTDGGALDPDGLTTPQTSQTDSESPTPTEDPSPTLDASAAAAAALALFETVHALPQADPSTVDKEALITAVAVPESEAAGWVDTNLSGVSAEGNLVVRGEVAVDTLEIEGDEATVCVSVAGRPESVDTGEPLHEDGAYSEGVYHLYDLTFSLADDGQTWLAHGFIPVTEQQEVRVQGKPEPEMQDVPVDCVPPTVQAELAALMERYAAAETEMFREGRDPTDLPDALIAVSTDHWLETWMSLPERDPDPDFPEVSYQDFEIQTVSAVEAFGEACRQPSGTVYRAEWRNEGGRWLVDSAASPRGEEETC